MPECTIWRYDTRRGLPWLRTRNILRDISRHQSLAGELTERTSPHRTCWRERDGRRSSTDIIILIITTTAIIIILISRVCTARSACEGPRRQSGSPVRLLTGSRCVLQGDGRYSGVVLERKVLAPPQRNLGWLKKHRWGNVPAGGGSVSGVSFGVLHLYDKADFRKVGLSTCIRRGCGSGLCRWMMQHSPLSTFFTLFPKQWHLIRAALGSLARPLSAGLSAFHVFVSAHRAQTTFQTLHLHFRWTMCIFLTNVVMVLILFFIFFKTLLFSYYRMLAVVPSHLVKRCWSLIWHKPAMVTVIHTDSSH